MTISEKVLQRLYIAGVGAATTVVTQKLLVAGWKLVTGEQPPAAGDPEATFASVLSWAAASAVGVAASQLVTRRVALRHLSRVHR